MLNINLNLKKSKNFRQKGGVLGDSVQKQDLEEKVEEK